MTALIFAGCTKIPEKTDIEELIGEISDEIANQCGNGITNEGEECDFEYIISCSSYDPETVGPIKCENCFLDFSNCQLKESCNANKCKSKGECKAIKYLDYEIYCDCFDNRTGEHCEYCSNYFHFDFDRECIPDSICTKIGCELENQECFIDGNSSKCRCKHPWTGEKCDECLSSYYYSDGECKSKFCSSGELECDKYEKCFDGNGKPECVCAGKHQDPDDCSKCLHGYDFVDYGDFCINEKEADCQHNPDAAENSFDIVKKVTVTYTDENGWTDPAYCKWACPDNTHLGDNKCNIILLETPPLDVDFPIGVDSKGNLYGGTFSGNIFSLSQSNYPYKSIKTSISSGRVGIDDNIYFKSSGYGIIDTQSWVNLYIRNTLSFSGTMTILNNGKMSLGNSFIENLSVERFDSNNSEEATSVSDASGNILTVYQNGFVSFRDEHLNLIWSAHYEDKILGRYPVISTKGKAYIPSCNSSNSISSIFVIDSYNGEMSENQIVLGKGCQVEYFPSVSIGNDGEIFVMEKGILSIFDAGNNLKLKTNNLYASQTSFSSVAPVITDNGYIYFVNGTKVICIKREGQIVWDHDIEYYASYLLHYNEILFVFAGGKIFRFSAPGNLQGDWPQILHDSRLSGSLSDMEPVSKPATPVLISPEANEPVKNTSISFEWNSGSENYSALFIKSGTYDQIIEGPADINSSTVENLPISDMMIWKVVAMSAEGAFSIAQSNFYTKSAFEKWRYRTDLYFKDIPTVYRDMILVPAQTNKLLLIDSSKTDSVILFDAQTSNYTGSTVDNDGSFYGVAGQYYFRIKDGNMDTKQIFSSNYYFYMNPVFSNCGNKMAFYYCSGMYDSGGDIFYISDFESSDELVGNSDIFNRSFYTRAVVNNRGVIFSNGLLSIWGGIIDETLYPAVMIFEDYVVFSGANNNFYAVKDEYPEFINDIMPLPGKLPAVVSKGEIVSTDYLNKTCSLLSGTPLQNEWRTLATWTCNSKPTKLAVSQDGTFFTFEEKNIIAIRAEEGVILNELVAESDILDVTLNEEGRLFVMTENKIMEIEHNADGANPYEWSQYRGNSKRTGSLKYDSCNTHAKIILQEPALYSEISGKNPLFKWDATDLENDPIKYDFQLYLDSVLVFEDLNIIGKSIQLPIELESGEQYTWSVTAKDGEQGNNKATSYFNTK